MAKEPKGLEKRIFSTVPTKALFNGGLTALEWRVLGLIALHDGMSLVKAAQGKPLGAGCVVSNVTLAREAQCSYPALVRAVGKLETEGLIERQDRRGGNALAAIRVRYDVPDNIPSDAVQYDELVTSGGSQNDEPVINGHAHYDEMTHFEGSKAAENSAEQPPHYSPRRGELYVAEAKELNSPKARDFAIAGQSGNNFRDHLPDNIADLSVSARVACFDRAWRAIGKRWNRIQAKDAEMLIEWLGRVFEQYADQTGQQALRLSEEIADAIAQAKA